MTANNVVEFHAPSGADGKPLYTTQQERDLYCFDQGYTLGYSQGQADAAALFMNEAEDDMHRATRWGFYLILAGMGLGVGASAAGWYVVAPLLWWLLS